MPVLLRFSKLRNPIINLNGRIAMIKNSYLAVFFLALGVLSSAGVAYGDEDGVVASAGDIRINATEMRPLIAFQEEAEGRKFADNPALLTELIRNEALRRLILSEAQKGGVDKDPKILFLIEQQKDQVLIDSYLAKMSKLPDAYPGREEVERFYKNNAGKFRSPAMVRLAQVYLPVPNDAPDSVQKEAGKKIFAIMEALKSRKIDFSEVTRSYPQVRVIDGKDVVWVPESALQDEIKAKVAVLAKLPKDTISKPVKTHTGWNIIKIIESKPERMETLDEVAPAIANQLRKKLFMENKRAYLYDLLTKNPINMAEPEKLKKLFGENP